MRRPPGDAPGWTPRWWDSRTLAALAGRMIRLEIELDNSRLLALCVGYFECRLSD